MKHILIIMLLAGTSLWAQQSSDGSRDLIIEYGGPVVQDTVNNTTVYTDVKFTLENLFLLTADKLTYYEREGVAEVVGNIKIDYTIDGGLVEVSAKRANIHLDGSAGVFDEVFVRFNDDFYFLGEKLEMLEYGERFVITRGTATACNQAKAQWSIRLDKARVKKEGYAVIQGVRFRVLDFPVIYLPYMIAPAMSERRSGLLTPDTGGSERNGTYFSQPIYWAPREDLDFTFVPTYHQSAGLQLGLESRWHTRPDLIGELAGSYFRDDVIRDLAVTDSVPVEDGEPLSDDRYRFTFHHRQKFWGGNLRVDVDAGSDFSVDRDYLEDAASTRVRDYTALASFDKPVGRNALFFSLNRLERIQAVGDRVAEVNQMPEVRFYMPNQHIGGGFFLRNYFYGDWFDYDDLLTGPDSEPISGDFFRGGVDSEVSNTFARSSLIRMRWGARYQGAFYRDSADDRDTDGSKGGAFGFLETVGPRFMRTYRSGEKRFVHYLDLVLSMKAGDRQSDPFLESVFFDELDIRLNEQVDGFQTGWRLNSRIFAGPRGNVRPFMDVEVSQDARIDSDEEQSPIKTRFRLINLRGFHANGIFDYNPDTESLDTLSLYSSINAKNWQGYGGYVRRRASDEIRQESLIGILQWNLDRWRSRFKVSLDYNFETSEFKSQEILYGYQGQCVGVTLNYVKSPFDSSATGNKDFFRITISLRNLANNIGSRF